jgi:hypothetical protein
MVWFLGLNDENGFEIEKGLNVRKNEVSRNLVMV